MAERPDYLRPYHAERIITAGRLLLALFLVVAVLLDSTEPIRYARLIQRVSVIYAVYAAAIAALTWARRTTISGLALVTHIADLVLFSVLMHFTVAPSSPFSMYLVFAIVCAAVRWHGRGALLTGAAALAGYVGMTLAGLYTAIPDEFERTRFITRCTQLSVLTLLLAYLGEHQHRLQREIARLAAWPRTTPAVEVDAVRGLLSEAASTLRAPRAILAWQEHEEPSTRLAVLDSEGFSLTSARPEVFGSLVARPLDRTSFLCDDAASSSCYAISRADTGFEGMRVQPLDRGFCAQHRIGSVLALRIASETLDGWLLALDRRGFSIDDLLLGDIVARLVGGTLEQQALMARLREAALADERLRLARELHDGVLQSLTAVGLHAGRLRALAAADDPEMASRLELLEDMILREQRGLRLVLQELHPGRAAAGARLDVSDRLQELAGLAARQWNVEVETEVPSDVPPLPARLVHELCRMAQESIVNAIRHGEARRIRVGLRADEAEVRLIVSYEGRGFTTFSGRQDLASLTRMGAGPRTLKERVEQLGGNLVIDSGNTGATLEIVVSTSA
jgi:signal transduction histidine kinase